MSKTMYETQPVGTDRPGETVARVATAIWLVVSAVNFVVWLLVSAISGDIDQPWFLWAFIGGGVVVGALRITARSVAKASA